MYDPILQRYGSNQPAWFPTTLRGALFFSMGAGVLLFFPHSQHDLLAFHPEALILVYYPLAVFAISWFTLAAIRDGFRLEARRHPDLCLEGERLEITLDLRYRGSLPFTYVLVRDAFPATDILQGPEIMVSPAMMDGEGLIRLRYVVEANRGFGDFLVGPLRLVVYDPLMLFSSEIDLPLTTPLKVLLHASPPGGVDLDKDNALTPLGDSRSTRTGSSLEFYGLKEYAYGDDIRALCWSKMAQTGKPVLKAFELDARPDVIMVVNTRQSKVKGFGFGNTLKRILRLATGFLGLFRQKGLTSRLVLPIDDLPQDLIVPPTASHHTFLREFFAQLEGSRTVDLPDLLELAAARAGPSTVLMVLSHTLDIPLDRTVEWLFVAQSRQARVALWILDDADMVYFNLQQREEKMDKALFVARMGELGIPVRLLPIRASAVNETRSKGESP